ncbi:MAG: hypothetical protein AAGG07_02145 [Planctomycetota bacterium]
MTTPAQDGPRVLPQTVFLNGGSVPGLGRVLAGNHADPDAPARAGRGSGIDAELQLGEPVVAWSGWLGEQPASGDGLWAASPETWGPAGMAAFPLVVEHLTERSRVAPILRPHARHLLCDPQRCLALLNGDGPRFRLLLDPVAMLTPEMLPQAEDHLVRSVEALGGRAETVGVLLSGAVEVDDPRLSGPELRLLPHGHQDSALDTGLVERIVGSANAPVWRLVAGG